MTRKLEEHGRFLQQNRAEFHPRAESWKPLLLFFQVDQTFQVQKTFSDEFLVTFTCFPILFSCIVNLHCISCNFCSVNPGLSGDVVRAQVPLILIFIFALEDSGKPWKTLPEAQWVQAIESSYWLQLSNLAARISNLHWLHIWPPGGVDFDDASLRLIVGPIIVIIVK